MVSRKDDPKAVTGKGSDKGNGGEPDQPGWGTDGRGIRKVSWGKEVVHSPCPYPLVLVEEMLLPAEYLLLDL